MPFNDILSSSIKIIFFDIGGVLLSNSWGHEARQKAYLILHWALLRHNLNSVFILMTDRCLFKPHNASGLTAFIITDWIATAKK